MKHKSWFWGVFFLAAAIFVVASQIGAFVSFGFWSIAAIVLLTAVFVASLVDLNFFGVTVSAALLYSISEKPLHFPFISIWLLLLAAVFAAIGLQMIFHRRRHWDKWSCGWHSKLNKHGFGKENIDGDTVFVRSRLSEVCKYLHSDGLKRAELVSTLGELQVYFDQCTLSPDGAVVNVDVSLGEMQLFIPKTWHVTSGVETGLGGENDCGDNIPPAPDAPRLRLVGKVSLGELQIHYI